MQKVIVLVLGLRFYGDGTNGSSQMDRKAELRVAVLREKAPRPKFK